MAKTITLTLGTETVEFAFAKIDRDKLYGRKLRVVVDQDGVSCTSAYLSSDGAALVPSGSLAMLYVDEAADTVERSELQTVDEHGQPVPLVPSTLGIAQDLKPASARDLLDHVAATVYHLESTAVPAGIAEALAKGAIFSFRFCYRDDYSDRPGFLIRNDGGIFALIGEAHGFDFVRQAATAAPAEEADEAGDDDLDFSMI
jgi:hypothetical protein